MMSGSKNVMLEAECFLQNICIYLSFSFSWNKVEFVVLIHILAKSEE